MNSDDMDRVTGRIESFLQRLGVFVKHGNIEPENYFDPFHRLQFTPEEVKKLQQANRN